MFEISADFQLAGISGTERELLSQDPSSKAEDRQSRPTLPAPASKCASGPPRSSTSYCFVNRKGQQVERPSVPPMISRIELERTSGRTEDDERHTADLTEQALIVVRATHEVVPEDLFYIMFSLMQGQFKKELAEDQRFLRVRYFVPTPDALVDVCGPVTTAYDVCFCDVSWTELQEVILAHAGRTAPGEGPRGIHFVHEPRARRGGGLSVHEKDRPTFSLDVSIDGKGRIPEATADVEMWTSFTMVSPGPEHVQASLRCASGLILNFVQNLVRLAENLEHPIGRDSSLVDFFFLLDAMRTADAENHETDLALIPAGAPLYEFGATAMFHGRELEVTVTDSTGFVHRTAQHICDVSRRINQPLRGFSVSIKGDGRTVMLERRFSDQRHGPDPVRVEKPQGA